MSTLVADLKLSHRRSSSVGPYGLLGRSCTLDATTWCQLARRGAGQVCGVHNCGCLCQQLQSLSFMSFDISVTSVCLSSATSGTTPYELLFFWFAVGVNWLWIVVPIWLIVCATQTIQCQAAAANTAALARIGRRTSRSPSPSSKVK